MASAVKAPPAKELIDPTKPARYPIVLSDALLGKTPTEVLTGVRCKESSSLY